MACKAYRELKKLADSYGRKVVQAGSGHYRLECKRGERPLVVAQTSGSDHRGMKNLICQLRNNDKPKARTAK